MTSARRAGALLFTSVLPVVALASCDEDPYETVTYHTAVRPLIEAKCARCHYEGGPTPYDFTYKPEAWADGRRPAWVELAIDAVESGRMPPWMPAPDCKPIAVDRSLTAEERGLFTRWKDGGKPLGDPAYYVRPEPRVEPVQGDPDLTFEPAEAYVPSRERQDDYRCFFVGPTFDQETYLTATTVVPGDKSLVHHALIYMIPAESVAAVEKLDAEEEGPGYTCFGGPGGGALTTLGAWVPGAEPVATPRDAALVVPQGARLVLQVHYNSHAYAPEAEIPAELSRVGLWTTADKPANRIVSLPLAHLRLAITAGDAASVQERTFVMPTDATLVSVAPHMHKLGKSIRVELHKPEAEPACLVDIPAWDFNWQQQYPFAPEEMLPVQKGDTVKVTCTYDNSPQNQENVDGQPMQPRDVVWGEGTSDEMCLSYVSLMVPYDTPDFRCGAYPACQAACADGDGACFFDCATVGGGQCAPCLIGAVARCVPKTTCAPSGIALNACMASSCTDEGPECITGPCADAFSAFYACMEPSLESGACAAELAACGLGGQPSP